MSKTLLTWNVGCTVLDPDHLPDGMYADDVAAELRAVLQKAADAWYAERGKDLLACEPEI